MNLQKVGEVWYRIRVSNKIVEWYLIIGEANDETCWNCLAVEEDGVSVHAIHKCWFGKDRKASSWDRQGELHPACLIDAKR